MGSVSFISSMIDARSPCAARKLRGIDGPEDERAFTGEGRIDSGCSWPLNQTTRHWDTPALAVNSPSPGHELAGLHADAGSSRLSAPFRGRSRVARRLIAGRSLGTGCYA